MKFLIPILIILYVSSGFTQAQKVDTGYTYLDLPDGAKARLGKSTIFKCILMLPYSKLPIKGNIRMDLQDTLEKYVMQLKNKPGTLRNVASVVKNITARMFQPKWETEVLGDRGQQHPDVSGYVELARHHFDGTNIIMEGMSLPITDPMTPFGVPPSSNIRGTKIHSIH